MLNVNQVKALFGVDVHTAQEIVAIMEDNGIDFSECTQKQFNKAAREAYQEWCVIHSGE